MTTFGALNKMDNSSVQKRLQQFWSENPIDPKKSFLSPGAPIIRRRSIFTSKNCLWAPECPWGDFCYRKCFVYFYFVYIYLCFFSLFRLEKRNPDDWYEARGGGAGEQSSKNSSFSFA